MTQTPHRKNYQYVTLTKNKKQHCLSVHRIVAKAFISSECHGLEVNHIDGNKLNNRSDNLEYVTCTENIRHAIRIGLRNLNGENGSASKLKMDDVRFIRFAGVFSNLSHPDLAKLFGVNRTTIGKIQRHETWREMSKCAPENTVR